MLKTLQVEMDSVREYVSQSDKVLELHNEIQGCDAILARMQEVRILAVPSTVSLQCKHLYHASSFYYRVERCLNHNICCTVLVICETSAC
jgi:hypothetical protein